MLNRSVIIVRPREPFIDWVASLDGGDELPEWEGEQTVYLVPEFDDEDERIGVLADAFDLIFEEELLAWHTDDADWPADRTLDLFLEWFDVECHSLVVDLCADALEDDSDSEE